MKGAVAAGHRLTAESAAEILRAGGNAFDAVIGGFFAACVTESVLASLGGGGFLLAREGDGQSRIFDFFTHTPRSKSLDKDVDFYPVIVDFGSVQQEFQIGLGTCAVPGAVHGMFALHQQLGRIPMTELVRPAVELARSGVTVNSFQSYLLDLVSPIYMTESAFSLYGSPSQPEKLLQPGDRFYNDSLADLLETLAIEGEALFYRGEIARCIVDGCRQGGGYLVPEDLEQYEVLMRKPLELAYRDHRLLTNPAPSAGGLLVAFGLELLSQFDLCADGFGGSAHLEPLLDSLGLTSEARSQCFSDGPSEKVLDPGLLQEYRQRVLGHPRVSRGTTHISIIDGDRNVASLTVSNGEGCGQLVPNAGFMMNNMLGEEDVNPAGFHQWKPHMRMSSMMAPSVLLSGDGTISALGSGGSNRIRTAILQVILNLVDFEQPPQEAVAGPRVHLEIDALSMESGFPENSVQFAAQKYPNYRVFDHRNMFFGGVHMAQINREGGFIGVGDPRRDGVAVVLE